jgi:SAM-dependent methyltransferase
MRLGRRTPEPFELTDADRRYLTTLHDDSVPLPEGAEEYLRPDNPRLIALRESYAALDSPVTAASRWHGDAVESFLDLRWFRGETLITWHYRELPRITALKYFVFMRYVRDRDELGLLDRLAEDGAFGCWTYDYPGHGLLSRDLIESVNELSFLDRELRLSERERFSVLDVGAGYGRLAHRTVEALAQIDDYCCVDAVPESTFVCDYYLRQRGVAPPARVVPLHEIDTALTPGGFDLAVNVHAWSECTHAAVEWWVVRLAELDVPRLLVVPNEPTELLTLEADGERRDYAPLLQRAGYRLVRRVPVIEDAAVRELVRLHDHFHLYERS